MRCARSRLYRRCEVDRPIVVVAFQATVEADELAFGGFETDFEALDFTEPAVHPGFGDSLAEVANDLDEAGTLPRRDAKHRTPQARVLMLARRSVGPAAVSHGYLA